MTRWLLNTFPTWVIGIVVIGSLVLITLAGLWLVGRLLPAVREGHANDFAGVMAGVIAAVYGVFLAIAIVALYEQMQDAEDNVHTEASILARIAREGDAYGGEARDRVFAAVRVYRNAVVGEEWEAMENGDPPPKGRHALEGIYDSIRTFEPKTASEKAFYQETVTAISELVAARRARLHAADATLPATFMILLVGGALITIGFTLVFGVASPRMHAVMGVSLAVLLGMCLLVALLLDHPFSGDVSISKEPYELGKLKRL